MPRVSAQERLHCSSIRQSRNAMDFHPDEGGLDSIFCSCTVKCGSGSLFRNVSRCSWWRYVGVIFLTCVVSSDLPPQPMTHQIFLSPWFTAVLPYVRSDAVVFQVCVFICSALRSLLRPPLICGVPAGRVP